MRIPLISPAVSSVALCFLPLAFAECEALDLIHFSGTENVLKQCHNTGPGSCLGTIEDVIDGDMNTAVMATSASSQEGAIDNIFITTEHNFPRPFELNEVHVKYFALGFANGATEYPREVGLHLGIEVKQGDTWKLIAEHPGGCRNNPTADTVCTIEGPLDRSAVGESDVTGLRVSLVASALRVGGAGFSRSEAKLFDVQAFADDVFCVEPGMDMHGHVGGGSGTIGGVDIWFANVLTAGCVEGNYIVAGPGQLPPELDFLLRPGNPVQAWDFTFDGSFNMATLKFHYDEDLLRGQQENNLMVFHQRPGGNGFENLPILEHDVVANTITVKTSSFSYIALAVVPEPATAILTVVGSVLLSVARLRTRAR